MDLQNEPFSLLPGAGDLDFDLDSLDFGGKGLGDECPDLSSLLATPATTQLGDSVDAFSSAFQTTNSEQALPASLGADRDELLLPSFFYGDNKALGSALGLSSFSPDSAGDSLTDDICSSVSLLPTSSQLASTGPNRTVSPDPLQSVSPSDLITQMSLSDSSSERDTPGSTGTPTLRTTLDGQDVKDPDLLKKLRQKERNRIAASRCRRRRIQRENELVNMLNMLRHHVDLLSSEVFRLNSQLVNHKQTLLRHAASGCPIYRAPALAL